MSRRAMEREAVACPLCVGVGCYQCAQTGSVSAWKYAELAEARRILDLPDTKPDLTVINFSGGTGSSALVWMVIRGEISRPRNLLVLNADPGMEDERTYAYIDKVFAACAEVGIETMRTEKMSLYDDLITAAARGRDRVDNPPFFVDRGAGKAPGQLMQKCTRAYKIEPMDRAIRAWMKGHMGIHPRAGRGLRAGMVEKWIGMTADEMGRVTEPKAGYQVFRYPLIGLGHTKASLKTWYAERGIEMPPRSVCIGCFANSPAYYAAMADERPSDFAKAVELDKAIRGLGPQIGATEGDLYLTRSMMSLESLVEKFRADGASATEEPDMGCQTGYCFY